MRMSGLSRAEIGDILGLSRERIRAILHRAAHIGVFTIRIDGKIYHGDI